MSMRRRRENDCTGLCSVGALTHCGLLQNGAERGGIWQSALVW